jgi:hypothetical protein
MSGFGAIIAELEDAFQSGVSEKRVDMLRRVTDLFVGRANVYTEEHVALFDDRECPAHRHQGAWFR